jgi:hypothetical protein
MKRSERRRRLVDQPPLLFHVSDAGFEEWVREALADYRETLANERRVLWIATTWRTSP